MTTCRTPEHTWLAECPPPDSPGLVADESLVGPLRNTRNASGFRLVYPHKWGYRAVVKWGGNERRVAGRRVGGGRLRHWPTVAHPQQAAAMVARWLKLRLGPRWAELVRVRRPRLWRKYAPFEASYVPGCRRKGLAGGWRLAVWVAGRREGVCGQDFKRLVYDSWSAAADAVPGVMARAHGPDWWGLLWR